MVEICRYLSLAPFVRVLSLSLASLLSLFCALVKSNPFASRPLRTLSHIYPGWGVTQERKSAFEAHVPGKGSLAGKHGKGRSRGKRSRGRGNMKNRTRAPQKTL